MKKMLLLPMLFSLMLFVLSCSKKSIQGTVETPKITSVDAVKVPDKQWQEHWFTQHNLLLSRVFYDNDVAVYYDKFTTSKITWPFKYIGDVWRYTKKTYGGFGADPRLYAVFHTDSTGVLSGGHPDYYYNELHDFKNMFDVGPGPWTQKEGNNIDMPTHEIFHILESAAFNTKGSFGYGAYPDGIWGDSKMAEIYLYDVYLGLGMTADAARWKALADNGAPEQFPSADARWFKNWLYPWYNEHGKTQVLVKFFKLAAENFSKDADRRYTRSMNWGEYIHFSSGAANADMKSLATAAFGWKPQWEQELKQARLDFPKVTYPH